MKKAREGFEFELAELEDVETLDGLSERVRVFCAQVAERLENLDFDAKRTALRLST